MKIILDLPDNVVAGKHLYILAGRELAAYKYLDPAPWMIKTARCNLCGKCCQNFRTTTDTFQLDEKGNCKFLKPEGNTMRCGKELNVPFSCIVGVGPYKNIPECTEKFEPVK